MRADDDPPERTDALERAYDDLARLRQLLVDARAGASPEWIAAAESAILRAEREVVRAGGNPAEVRGSLPAAGHTDGVDRLGDLASEV